jgi:NhaP-type Na+/H+ or K+/H+ antiporter
MPSAHILMFILAAVIAGGLTIGGVALVYFMDKRRPDPTTAETSGVGDTTARGTTARETA